jgi:hypothetical protein
VPEIQLAPDETVPGKPFADPEHTQREEAALRHLLTHERSRARAWANGGGTDVIIRETDDEGLRHLLVVPDTRSLLESVDLTVVGFFGRPREDADVSLLFDLEEELIGGMGAYVEAGLLSYYDLELVKGAYGNLILFSSANGPINWRENPVHHRAVEISPQNYHEIRLHKGSLPGRLLDGSELRLEQTTYIEYGGPDVWRAVRKVRAA